MVVAAPRERWRVGFIVDAGDAQVPARQFLRGLPAKPAAQMTAVLLAVRDAPPYRFAGSGKWEAMHGDMSGFHEVRGRSGQTLHRLFCLLDRSLDVPTLVVVSGGSKPNRSRMDPRIYAEGRRRRAQYERARDRGWIDDVLET